MKNVLGFLCVMFVVAVPALAADDAPAQQALARMQTDHPGLQSFAVAERLTRLYGTTFSNGSSPVRSAEAFRLNHAAVFGVEADELQPVTVVGTGDSTQPLMYDETTGTYKFTLVKYAQVRDGVPVYRADLGLLVRNEADYPLVLAASAVRELGNFTVRPEHRGVDARSAVVRDGFAKARGHAGRTVRGLNNYTTPDVVVWAGLDDMVVAPTTALVFTGDNGGPFDVADQRWLFIADITTGAILHYENMLIDVDVAGHVSALVTEGSAAEHCEDEVDMPMAYARVSIGGVHAFADEFGDFVIPNSGSSMVTVESAVRGEWFQIFEYSGSAPLLTKAVLPPGPADFLHNPDNQELTRAHVNAYVLANALRDHVLRFNPSYPTLSDTGFAITVNRTDGYCPCNAWYDPWEVSLNFCRTGGGCPNTAWSSVIFHEYGHHLVAAGGSDQDQYGEGVGDAISILMLDESGLGFGFFGDCGTPLREADNDVQYPCTGGSHDCGRLLSGCIWHTREALAAAYPSTYRDILSGLMVNSIPLHRGSTITPQITIDFMTLDDDDSDLSNGTPHYAQIQAGFSAHGMPGPALALIKFSYPDGLPESVMPNQPNIIRVDVEPLAGEPLAGTGKVVYRVGSGAFTTVAMVEINPHQYEATLPATDCPETIDYYFTAQAVGGATVKSPSDAPATVFSTVAAVDSVIVAEYDFETNPGWTVSGDATDGQWDRGIPVDCDRGDPASDHDQSSRCWLTDNSTGDGCNSDVDNGSTLLTSQIFDLTGLEDPQVTYARWYSNTYGGAPEADVFVVQVSDDGGSSWQTLETVGPAGAEVDGGWYVKTFRIADFVTLTDQFRIRFNASDLGTGSVVEAAVDAFRIFDYECDAPEVYTVAPDGFTRVRGRIMSGGLAELLASDDAYLVVNPGFVLVAGEAPIRLIIDGSAAGADPAGMKFTLEARADTIGLQQRIELFNHVTQSYETVDVRAATMMETVTNAEIDGDVSRFINPTTMEMSAQVSWKAVGPIMHYPWTIRIDQTSWTVTP